MQEELNLVQKLAKIRAMSDVVVKGKRGYNYTYADITEILAHITAGMKKYGVTLIPTIVPGTSTVCQNAIVKTKVDKTGRTYDSTTTEMLYSAEMIFKWVNDNDPEEIIEVPWYVVGSQEDPSQAFGSGLTYCTRYFLTNYFQIAQPDTDVDTYRSKQKAAGAAEDKALAEELIAAFDAILKDYLQAHPDKAEDVKKFISKYVKGANYFAIKESALAAKLKSDLGIFGLADCLIQMGITYGSKKAIMLSNQIGFAIADEAIHTSAMLAKEYGHYPMYNAPAVMSSDFFQNNVSPTTLEAVKQFGLRNSQLLTIAPTGTLSSMLGVSGGIEPIFANFYTRKTESLHGHDEYYKVYTPIVERYMKVHDLTDDSELPEYFVTAQTIHYMNRVEMQAAWQNHIDASISSTVNVPNDFTVEDVSNLYMQAWAHGLKGITMFRDGCKRAGILTTDTPKKSDVEESTEVLPRGYIIDASDDLVGKKRKLITGCGSLHCEAFFDPATGDLMETFLSKGSTGGCNNSLIGLSRMISIAARAGCHIETIVDQLNSCGSCPSYAVRRATKHDTSKGSCCPMAVGNALLDMWNEMQNDIKCNDEELGRSEKTKAVKKRGKAITTAQTLCPECGEPLVYEGGCVSCKSCGWSKCN